MDYDNNIPAGGIHSDSFCEMERFRLSPREAGNVTYRRCEIRCPMVRPTADAMLKELNEMGAYAGLRQIDAVLWEEDLPSGYQPGPLESFPPRDPGTPVSVNVPPDRPDAAALAAKLKIRRDELEAMDAADEQEQEKRRADRLAKQLDNGKSSPQKSP